MEIKNQGNLNNIYGRCAFLKEKLNYNLKFIIETLFLIFYLEKRISAISPLPNLFMSDIISKIFLTTKGFFAF